MTNEEVRDLVVKTLDEIEFAYDDSLKGDRFLKPGYKEKYRCMDGVERNVYTLAFFLQRKQPDTNGVQVAVVDADAKNVVMIVGPSFYRMVVKDEDGKLTLGPEQ